MRSVGLKELHDQTGTIVRQVRDRAQEVVIEERGVALARLVPVASPGSDSWREILAPVRKAAKAFADRGAAREPNPVIAARRRRDHATRLRR